jgi:hypothetical protein
VQHFLQLLDGGAPLAGKDGRSWANGQHADLDRQSQLVCPGLDPPQVVVLYTGKRFQVGEMDEVQADLARVFQVLKRVPRLGPQGIDVNAQFHRYPPLPGQRGPGSA